MRPYFAWDLDHDTDTSEANEGRRKAVGVNGRGKVIMGYEIMKR